MASETLVAIMKNGRIVEVISESEIPDDLRTELVAEKLLEIPSSGLFTRMTQKEADLIWEPKD